MSVHILKTVKRFGNHTAVDGITVDIPTGEFFVVLGPSGCGKSTLLRLIAGLEALDQGKIMLEGITVSGPDVHMAPEDRQIGFVFQSYALWPHMTVAENVAFPIEAAGESHSEGRRQAARYLRTVALEDFAERRPAELSGGQRQRVALARCLAGQAQTILMDEPLANLDPHLRAAMEEELSRFHRTTGATTIYITHDQREAMALADRVAVMSNGRFLQVGSPAEIYEQPSSEAVARFIGRSAVLDAVLFTAADQDAKARLGPFDIQAHGTSTFTKGQQRVVVRPTDVTLINNSAEAGAVGQITASIYRGGIWETRIEVEGLTEALPATTVDRLDVGETVRLQINRCWVLPAS